MNKLKGIIYDWVLYAAVLGRRKRSSTKKILIVRVDEIGDYMLWRPFLKTLVESGLDKGCEYHFCGNKSWKSLFETFDAHLVTQCFWLDKMAFKKKMSYRYRFLKTIYLQDYDTVINPTFSRDRRYDDSIVMAAKADTNIGMVANLDSTRDYEIGYDKGLYNPLVSSPDEPTFEFLTNRGFADAATFFIKKDNSLFPSNTRIDTTLLPSLPFNLPEKYFVVFPGSRSKTRIWSTEHFVRVSNHIFENYGWTVVIAGTNSDKEYTDAFTSQYKHTFVDLTGKTSLTEMLSLLKDAQCLLTVDTGSVHLAAAVGCTVFGVFNGSQYGRFAPYPKKVADNVYAIYPDDVEQELKDPELVKQKYEFVVSVPYDSVKPEKVILAIHQHYTMDHRP